MKIGIVGCGQVGSSSAYACALRGIGSELVLVDKNADLARAQAEDILHATPFAAAMPVCAGNYGDLSGAAIVMIAAGASQKPGETRLDLLKRNADILGGIIPSILKAAPDAILLIASNPVDIMTHMAASIAAEHGVARGRVIGSGTILDTARFRALLAQHLGVSSHSVHAHVLGEHGDSEVLHWSGATVSNLPLADFSKQMERPVTPAFKEEMDEDVRRAAYRIIQGKGATWYGIGAGMARLAESILRDERAVFTCSAYHEKIEGVGPVTLSLPAIVSAKGVEKIFYPQLDDDESAALKRSAEILREAITSIGF